MKYTQTLNHNWFYPVVGKTRLKFFFLFVFALLGAANLSAQCAGSYSNIVINEVSGDSGQSDGCNDGILELAGPAGADIGCMVVSNGEWAVVFPTGTVIPADGTFLIACSEDPTGNCGVGLTGSTNGLTCDECDFPNLIIDFDVCLPANAANYDPGATGFSIDNANGSDGDQIVLFQPDGTVHDAVKWGAATATSGAGTTSGGASGDADNVAPTTNAMGYTLGTAGIRGDGGSDIGVPVVPLGTCTAGSTYTMPLTSDTVYVDLSPVFRGCNSSYVRVLSGCGGANGSPTHLDNNTCTAIPSSALVPSACAAITAGLQWGYTDHPTPGLANDTEAWEFSVDMTSVCGASGVFTFTLEVYNWQSVSGDDPPVPGGNPIDAGSGSLDEQIGSFVIGPAIDGNLVDDPTGFPVSIWTTYNRNDVTGVTTLTYTTAALPPGAYDYTLQWDDFTNCCGSISETSGNECYERMDFTVEVVEDIAGAAIDPCNGDGTVSVTTTGGTGISYTLVKDGVDVNSNTSGVFSGIIDDADPDPVFSVRLNNACSMVVLPVPAACFGTPPCPTLSYSCMLPDGPLCPDEPIDLTVTGQNIPAGTNINYYYSNTTPFDPYMGEGTLMTSVTTPIATSIVINEILFDPIGDDGNSPNDEWVELFGPAGTDMGCYVLTDGTYVVVIPPGTNMPASGFLTIGNTAAGGPEGLCGDEVPTIDVSTCNCLFSGSTGNPSTTTFVHTNGAEQVAIFDAMGTFVDGISWGGGNGGIGNTANFGAVGSCSAGSVDLSTGVFENIADNDGNGTSIGRFPDGSSTLMAFSNDADCDDGNLPKSFNAPNNLVTSYEFDASFCNIGGNGNINIIGIIEGLDLANCSPSCTNGTIDGCDDVCNAPLEINITCPVADLVPVAVDQCVGDGPILITVNLSGLTSDNYCIQYAIDGVDQTPISAPSTATSTTITVPDVSTGGEVKVTLTGVDQSADCSMGPDGCNGTIDTDEACINIRPIPTAAIIDSVDVMACDGSDNGLLEFEFTGTGPFDFEYKINGGSPIAVAGISSPYVLEVATAGVYTLCSVSDEAGCVGTANGSATILPPAGATVVTVTPDSLTICDNGLTDVDLLAEFTYTPTYNATDFTFFSVNPLSGGFNAALHTLTSTTVTPSASTIYYVQYIDPTTGCMSIAPLNIVFDSSVCPPFICPTMSNFTDPADICQGDSFDLTASGLFNMAATTNGETDFGISFVYFTGSLPPPSDPYSGGSIMANLLFGELDGFDLTRTGTATGLGSNLISGTYTICVILNPAPTDPACNPSLCIEIVVNPRPTIPTNPMDASYCGRSRPAAISVAIPPAGTTITWWTAATGGMQVTGGGMTPSGNQLTLGPTSNPSPPAAGTSLTLYAEATDPTTGCGSTMRIPVTLTHFADPIVAFTAPDDLCANDGVQNNLTGGTPEGGTYVGPGVIDDGNGMTYDFDPAAAGVGVQTITYSFTDANGCSASASDMVEVLEVPMTPAAMDIEVCEGGSTEITPTDGSGGSISMTLLSEFFETDGNGTRYTTSVPEFTDSSTDFFLRTDGSNINTDYMVSGQQGNFYFAAQDVNGEGGPAQVTLTFTGVDITGKTNLSLDVLLAEDDSNDGNEDWDDTASDNNFLHIDYQIDGGGFQNLLHVEGDNMGASNGAPRIDTDFDGVGEGTEITNVFQNFNAAISDTGTTLDLRVTINLEDGDEDIAFDNLILEGISTDGVMFKYYDADPAGGTATLLAGPTVLPYDPGTTPAMSPQTVYVTVCAENGCESSAIPVVVTVYPLPELMAVVTDVTGCPADASGAIDLSVTGGSAAYTYLWATPNGSGLVPADEDQSNLTTGNYNVTVTDANMCVSTLDLFVADAIDDVPPMITCPDTMVVNCGESTLPTNTGTAVSMDGCSPVVILSYVDTTLLDGCGGLTGTLTRTWSATDAFGNVANCEQIIHIVDETDPTFTLPIDTTIECYQDPDDLTLTGNVTNVMDNCGTHPLMQIWINELHYDNAGTDVGEFIEIAGTAGLSLAGYDLVLYNGSGTTMSPFNTIALTGAIPDEGDGFGAVSVATPGLMNGSPDGFALVDPAGIVLYFYSYEGTFMALSGAAQGMTSIDIGVSEGTNTPVGQSLQLIGTGSALMDFNWTGPVAESPGLLNVGQTLEALAFAAPMVDYNDVFVANDPNCPSGGIITRTWTVTDVCGNDTEMDQIITVVDTEAPIISCPPNVTIECGTDESPTATGMATAVDSCDTNPMIAFMDVETPGACPQEKTITRTWTATDNCNNSTQCIQIITVEDSTPPVPPVIVPIINIQCANEIPDPVTLTATDNCSPDITVSPTDVFTAGSCASRFTLTRTWTFTDECNNMASTSQVINVIDDEPLVLLSCAPDQIVECASGAIAQPFLMQVQTPCNSNYTVETLGPEVVGTVNCPNTEYIYTYVATDDCGRTISCQQTYTIANDGPVFVCPPDICVIDCPADYAMMQATFDAYASVATVLTSCPGPEPTIVNDFSPSNFINTDCNSGALAYPNVIQYQTVTFTATDQCGRMTTCSAIVVVTDNNGPVIEGEPYLTIRECDDNVQNEYDAWIAANLANLTATDGCSEATWSHSPASPNQGPWVNGYAVTHVIFTATDACGNASSKDIHFKLKNNFPPSWVGNLVDKTVDCADPLPDFDIPTYIHACGITTLTSADVTLPGACANAYSITRTWTVTDNCEGVNTTSQTITVTDNTAPVLPMVPADLMLTCASEVPPAMSLTAVDNCAGNISVAPVDDMIAGTCVNEFTIVRTWTFDDGCGNISSISQTIEVDDNIAPVFSNIPTGGSAQCQDDITFDSEPTVSDNCGGFTLSSQDIVAGDDCSGSITRTWSATDDCGNIATASATISYSDTEAPMASNVPVDTTISCNDPIVFGTAPTWTDNCDDDVFNSFEDVISQGVCASEMIVERSWSGIDECGNLAVVSQKIYIEDNEAPTFTFVPDGGVMECGNDPSFGTPTATDNCAGDVIITFEDDANGNGPCNSETTRTWTATDICGNATTASRTIMIMDNEVPTFTSVPDGGSFECGSSFGDATATDNCGMVTITFDDVVNGSNCDGSTTRTWTATDLCGNATTVSRTMIIMDDEPPVFTFVPETPDVGCGNIPDFEIPVATDNCGTVDLTFVEYQSPGTLCDEGYALKRDWTATDACGNTAEVTTVIWVNPDIDGPVFTFVPEGALITCDEFPPTFGEPEVMDDCSEVTLTFITEYVTGGPSSCDDGENFDYRRVWTATDACGNETTAKQTFWVKASEIELAIVSGHIYDEENEMVNEVEVTVEGAVTNGSTSMMTGNDGFYEFPLSVGFNYMLTPYKNDEPLNGVTTYDLILMSKHILGIEALDSPYKMIAADINRSGQITGFDLVELRKLILFINTEFQGNTSWRFVESNFVFPNPTNPFATTFPEDHSINGLTQAELIDFIAVKTGDVNASAIANQLTSGDTRDKEGALIFKLKDQQLKAGEEFVVDFTAANFKDLLGYQFTLQLDPRMAELISIEPGVLPALTDDNFGWSKWSEGAITTSWNANHPQNLEDGAKVFSIVIQPKVDIQLSEILSIGHSYTQAEAYDSNADLLDLNLEFMDEKGVTQTKETFALLQNQPNPFKQTTVIGFQLPSATFATLTLYDVSGRILKTIAEPFTAGYHEWTIDQHDLNTTGVLYYQLKTDQHSATRKMILVP